MTDDAYAESVRYLQGLETSRGWDLGLERVGRALALRGNPERALRAVHLAGTNGKGTTAAVVESVLRAGGYKTGLYTSPHLVDFAERIRAGGRTIPRAVVVDMVRELRGVFDEAGLALTHFEFVTVLALEWFTEIGVEAAVIEVGLGGRLDATNHVRPVVSIVTSIALDHEEYLGGDLSTIAREKAGIVKAGVPVCIGRLAPDAEAVLVETAVTCNAPLLRCEVDATLERDGDAWTFRGPGTEWRGLHDVAATRWQRRHQTLALLALATARGTWPVDEVAVRSGLAALRWPGRLSVLPGPPRVVLDGAHNAAGVRALVTELPRLLGARRARLVFACGRDRRWEEMVAALAPWAADVVVTEVGRRAAPAAAVATAFESRDVPVRIESDSRRAVAAALDGPGDGTVLVTGSLFLVGDAYDVLEAAPLFEPWQGWRAGATEPP